MNTRQRRGKGRGWSQTKRARAINILASELFGQYWEGALRERLLERYGVASPIDLTGAQSSWEIEFITSGLARAMGIHRARVKQLLDDRLMEKKHGIKRQ